MPVYRIYRMKAGPREAFRWAAHIGGLATAKMKDYDPSGEIEAETPYAAWKLLNAEATPIRPGDLLELVTSEGVARDLKIAKYIGFEPAQWYVPEPKTELVVSSAPSAAGAEP